MTRLRSTVLGLAGLLSAFSARPGMAETQPPVPVTIALPAQSFLFSPVYIAVERGYFRENGIEPKVIYVSGPGVIPAVLGRSADFALIFGGIQVSAAARNQKLLAIGNTQDRFTTDIIVRKPVADKLATAAMADTSARMRALKGLTIGVDAINGLPHAYLRFLARKAGMNPETDFTITPLAPQAMVAAMKAGTIDAMAFSPPFSLSAIKDGAVEWIAGPEVDLPELRNFPNNVVVVRPDYCQPQPERCRGFIAALRKAAALMKGDPDASIASLAKTFDKMPLDVLKPSAQVFARYVSGDMSLKPGMYTNVVAFDRISGIVPEGTPIPPEAELFTTTYTQ